MKRDSLGRPKAPEQNLLSKAVTFTRENGVAATLARSLHFLRSRAQGFKNHSARSSIDEEFDTQFGLDTGGSFDVHELDLVGAAASATAYQAIYPIPFCQVLDRLPIRFEEYTFIDFGSGKGRAVFLASKYPFKKIIGVEFAKDLHAIALKNLKIAKAKISRPERVRLLCEDAGKTGIPLGPLVMFFYNPFGDDIMDQISNNLQRSLEISSREIWIIHFWPLCSKSWEKSPYEEVKIPKPDWPTPTKERVVKVWRVKRP